MSERTATFAAQPAVESAYSDRMNLCTAFRVCLEDDVTALLMDLSEACHCPPTKLIAALVGDVLREDARAHQINAGVEHERLHS